VDKKIENLTDLKGKILLFGGIYSNLQALESLIEIAKKENIAPKNCISTGDIVGYCAQPEEAVQTFKNWGARGIAGNVEMQLRDGEEGCGCDFRQGSRCDDFSKQWYPYAQSKLSQNSLDFMQTLPDHFTFNFGGKDVMVLHGSYFQTSEFIFKSTAWKKKEPNFIETKSDVIIGGHCGIPFYHEKNDKLWINAGVIGMPANDGTPNVWYVIIDEQNGEFNFKHHSYSYNHQKTSKLMQNDLLPIEYARTLITGLWDNCEILPPVESGLQGFGIQL
jgi:predicted phosphodiesterase